MREDGGDIELSAMIADDLVSNIRFRDFSRDEAIVSKLKLINGSVFRWTYHLKSGELHIQKGDTASANHFLFDSSDESFREINNEIKEPIVVTDISRWWDENM